LPDDTLLTRNDEFEPQALDKWVKQQIHCHRQLVTATLQPVPMAVSPAAAKQRLRNTVLDFFVEGG